MSKLFDVFGKSTERIRQQQEIEYIRDRVLAKFPLLGTTMAHLKTAPATRVGGEEIDTAATDGKTIFYNPDWFMNLPDDEKVFVYAHEIMHVAFNHILRSGNRNHKLWNKATDAVINQILKSESLPMPEHGVDIAEALQHSAEEMYEKLVAEKEERKKKKEQDKQNKGDKGEKQQSEGGGGESDMDDDDDDDENEQAGHDNHNIWKEAVRQAEKEQEREERKKQGSMPKQSESKSDKPERENDKSEKTGGNSEKQSPEGDQNTGASQGSDMGGEQPEFGNWNPSDETEFEKGFERENRRERTQQAVNAQRQLDIEKNRAMDAASHDSGRTFGAVGKSDAVMDWKRILKKTIEEERDKWSYRRSDADNDFMARVEEEDDEDRADTEVMLDVSGSVSDSFLREFLRQLKPLLKNGKLRVGCFDEHFYGLTEVKSESYIDKFKITAKSRWTENWDLAVKSFSKNKDVNKIVFTDGWPAPGTMPDESTKGVKNLIWLVYGNPDFHPISGKVIQVNPRTIQQRFTMTPHTAAIVKTIERR